MTGRVIDETELPLPGVTVELDSMTMDMEAETVTSMDGSYRFDVVPPGWAEVSFKMINFGTTRQEVTVTAGESVSADAILRISLTADITITAPRTFRNLAEIENPEETLVGVAAAASEGAITAAQLSTRPIMRAGELLEAVPGMIISQHSGEGKANQYYLRSFNLDHGSDFATSVAGIPVNNPTHGHAQGYSDLNFVIPELVSGVQFRKGPYYAEQGDFSAAGAANINYVNRLDRSIVSLSGGTHGWGRVLGTTSPELGSGHLLAALELNRNGGPWDRPDDYERVNGVLRYSRGDSRNGFSVTGLGYSADWGSTDQVPVRAITNGLISRFGNLDPSDGGRSFRYSAIADAQHSGTKHSTRGSAYVVRYGVNLFQNFTYFLDNPQTGDQFEQVDRRVIAGGRLDGVCRRRGAMKWDRRPSEFSRRVRSSGVGCFEPPSGFEGTCTSSTSRPTIRSTPGPGATAS